MTEQTHKNSKDFSGVATGCMFGAMDWMGTGAFSQAMQMHADFVSFISDRLAEDLKTQNALLRCKTIEDARDIQIAFVQKVYQDYAAEAGRLASAGLCGPVLSGTKHTPV